MTRATEGAHTASCGALERLAERAPDLFICRCTCGALHLVWENATVQLRPHDLRTLRHALEFGHVAPFRVLPDGDPDTVQVWLYNTGLRLDGEGWATFTGLVREAEARLWALEHPTLSTHRPLHVN